MLELKNVSYVVDDDGGKKEILKNINLKVEERICNGLKTSVSRE